MLVKSFVCVIQRHARRLSDKLHIDKLLPDKLLTESPRNTACMYFYMHSNKINQTSETLELSKLTVKVCSNQTWDKSDNLSISLSN